MSKAGRWDATFLPSLTQLRAFSEAARLDSISRASEELRRAQSAITQAVQNLEAELGVALLARTSTGSYLTDMGRILQRRAESCFARLDGALAELLQEEGAAPALASASRRITRSQIVALTAVDEFGSFAQAARQVHMSVTSLHRSARTLEQQLGRPLLKQTAQGTTTNEDGRRLSNQMRLAMRELEWAEEEIRSQNGQLKGRLLVGAGMLTGNHYITLELDHFIPEYPHVSTTLLNGTYDYLLGKLRNGSIDMVVGLLKDPPPTDDVVEEALGHDPYLVAAARNHPLAGRSGLTLSDLQASEWIIGRSGTGRRSTLERIFGDGPPPRLSLETHSLPAIFLLLASGNRMAILTRSELALEQRLGNQLTALDYPIDAPRAAVGVTVRRNWEPNMVQRTFLDFLRSRAKDRLSQLAGRSGTG